MNFNFVLLYVADPTASAAFYQRILGRESIQASPGYAMFALDSNVMLGLWLRTDVQPGATGAPGSSEISFLEPSDDAVRARCRAWREAGVKIAQEPTAMSFGFTFVGLDPDGHRLRVYARPA